MRCGKEAAQGPGVRGQSTPEAEATVQARAAVEDRAPGDRQGREAAQAAGRVKVQVKGPAEQGLVPQATK